MLKVFCRNVSVFFLIVACSSPAHAYYMESSHRGNLTIKTSGACAMPPITYEWAHAGDIYDFGSWVGWGFLTNDHELLLIERRRLFKSIKVGNGKIISKFIPDFESETFLSLINDVSSCEIVALESDGKSEGVFDCDVDGPCDVSIKYKFTGYLTDVCVTKNNLDYCYSRSFKGVVYFKTRYE